MTRPRLMTTPFHLRTATHNGESAWRRCGKYSVAARYTNVFEEALAARISVIMADVTALPRIRICGSGAARLLSAACAVDVAALGAGEALRVMWRADGGGVRGTGVIVRVGPERFLLEGADVDIAWFERAGPRFGAKIEEGEGSRGSLYVAGPFADVMLKSCGLEAVAKLEPYRQLVYEWHGILVVASR